MTTTKFSGFWTPSWIPLVRILANFSQIYITNVILLRFVYIKPWVPLVREKTYPKSDPILKMTLTMRGHPMLLFIIKLIQC